MAYVKFDSGVRFDSGARYDDANPEPPTSTTMKYIKLGLSDLNVDGKVAQGNAIKTGMTGNINFPSPNPTPGTLGTVTNDLAAKKIARDNLVEACKAATEALHLAEKLYDLTITQIAAYAEGAVLGDPVKLEGAGFTMRKNPQPIGTPGQVQDLRLTSNTFAGRLFARWEPVKGVSSYEVQICPDPVVEANWRGLTPSTASNYVIEGLPSATRQWLRVRAVTKKAVGPWSQLANKVVP